MKRNFLHPAYGIYVVAVWAIVLGLQNMLSLMYTSSLNSPGPVADTALTRHFIYQWISSGFSLAFVVAAPGLWYKKNWARRLFLVSIVIYFVISLIGLVLSPPQNVPPFIIGWLFVRYLLSIGLPTVYLNLPFVKQMFYLTTEPVSHD